MRNPARDKTHITDKKAQIFLDSIVVNGMILRKMEPDYFIDYQGELTDAIGPSNPSGKKISIQLKGTEKPRYDKKKDCLYFDVKIKHLRYYSECEHQAPVFLVIVDVPLSCAYYLFMQEYLDGLPADWLNKSDDSKLSVSIPLCNDLADFNAFSVKAVHSIDYMKRRHPGSIADAVKGRIRDLSKVEPRFKESLQNSW